MSCYCGITDVRTGDVKNAVKTLIAQSSFTLDPRLCISFQLTTSRYGYRYVPEDRQSVSPPDRCLGPDCMLS